MIDEQTIQKIVVYDKIFSTKSRAFPLMDLILVSTPLDNWRIEILNKKDKKKICLLHENKRGRRNRFHIQAYKGSLYDTYHSIYTHKNWLSVLNKNTYTKETINE